MKTIKITGIQITVARLTKSPDARWQLNLEGNEMDSTGAVVRPATYFEVLDKTGQALAETLINAPLTRMKQENGIVASPKKATAKARGAHVKTKK